MSFAPTVTAAMITLNEAANMPGLVRSLAWADEVVVVDGGSNDATVEIARRLGCRVIEHPFDNYAAQRNRAIAAAKSEWVLSIDGDERPTPYLVEELRGQLLWGDYVAYRVPIRSRIFGRKMRFSGTQDDRPIRLFRREPCRWQGDVHEVLHAPGRIGQLTGWLDHETLPDLSAFLGKMERYTSLEARRRVTAGQPPRWRDQWLHPVVEVLRRMVWKAGILDGPQGWAFCCLSGLSQWVQADKHARLWRDLQTTEAQPAVAPADIEVTEPPALHVCRQRIASSTASQQHAPRSEHVGPHADRVCFQRRMS